MKQKYRDHWDVLAAVLENLQRTNNEGAGLTYLIFTVETAWNTLLSLLDELLNEEMIGTKALPAIRPDLKRRMIFFITPKGIEFLHIYRELKETLGSEI